MHFGLHFGNCFTLSDHDLPRTRSLKEIHYRDINWNRTLDLLSNYVDEQTSHKIVPVKERRAREEKGQ